MHISLLHQPQCTVYCCRQKASACTNILEMHDHLRVLVRSLSVQSDVQQAFLQYKYKAEAALGAISIFPMTERDLPGTTELLTQSFSESMGYFSVYRFAPKALSTISAAARP